MNPSNRLTRVVVLTTSILLGGLYVAHRAGAFALSRFDNAHVEKIEAAGVQPPVEPLESGSTAASPAPGAQRGVTPPPETAPAAFPLQVHDDGTLLSIEARRRRLAAFVPTPVQDDGTVRGVDTGQRQRQFLPGSKSARIVMPDKDLPTKKDLKVAGNAKRD